MSRKCLAQNRRHIQNLSDYSRTWTQPRTQSKSQKMCWIRGWLGTYDHLICEGTLNHLAKLAKWLSCVLSTQSNDTVRIYSQMHHIGKYSQHSSIIWPVWLNGWAFPYHLSSCGFESHCSHLNFRCCTCLEQRVPWH